MAKRRGRGEGSITQRADGRWMGRVELGWEHGRRRRKAVYGRTRQEVAGKIRQAQDQADKGLPFPNERQTVGEFLQSWLTQKQRALRPRAFASYEQTIRDHLLPGLEKLPLWKVTPQHVAAWFDRHQTAGASARTIRYARAILRAALNQALSWGLVARNVASLVEAPRHVAKQIQPLTPEQARTLIDAARPHRLGALLSVATALGLRLGEAVGLRWVDINFPAGELSVRQALERSGGNGAVRRPLVQKRHDLRRRLKAAPPRSAERRELREQLAALRVEWRKVRTTLRVTEPKSARSRRTVKMPSVVIVALKAHRVQQNKERLATGGEWVDSGLVFTTPRGTPLDPRNATREYRTILADADLPPARFHDLRHTAATLLLAQGVDPRTIMETLGHSQISLTLNTYSHVMPALQADAAAKIDAILG